MLNEILPEDVSEYDRRRILERVAREIVRRRLTAPAIFFLEMCKPLSFIGGQAMIVLEPFVQAIFSVADYRKFALMMEETENVEELITLIESYDRGSREGKEES